MHVILHSSRSPVVASSPYRGLLSRGAGLSACHLPKYTETSGAEMLQAEMLRAAMVIVRSGRDGIKPVSRDGRDGKAWDNTASRGIEETRSESCLNLN